MIKKVALIVFICLIGFSFGQNSINNYKYVVVPIQFDFLKGEDQYRTSSLTKYLFNKLGVETYFDVQELPEELFNDRCKALYADVNKLKGGFLRTNIQIELKDCKGKIVQTSEVISTKEKDFGKAYNETIRKAFESFELMGYSYQPIVDENQIVENSEEKISGVSSSDSEIQRLKNEIKTLKQEKKEASETIEEKKLVIEKEENVSEERPKEKPAAISADLLYAQKIEGGFQLVDSEPKKVMVLLNTAAPNVYTVKGKDAIVFQKDGQWIYSENTGTNKTEKILNIKF